MAWPGFIDFVPFHGVHFLRSSVIFKTFLLLFSLSLVDLARLGCPRFIVECRMANVHIVFFT